MTAYDPTAAEAQAILASVKTIAVVGVSDKPQRDSNQVFTFLLACGYDCVGVNPALAGQTVHGAPVYASLAEIGRPIDMVDVFRASDAVPGIVEEVLRLDPLPKVFWTQLGVFDQAAGDRAAAAGMKVVMNRCPKIELGH